LGLLDNEISIWDLENGRELQTLVGNQHPINFLLLHDDKLISGSDGTIKVWDYKDKKNLQTLIGHQLSISCLLVHDGKLISGSSDRTIKVWDLESGKELQTLIGHTGVIMCLLVHDGKLISGSNDETIKIWDLESGKALRTLTSHMISVDCLLVHDGKLISGSADETIKIWDLENGKELQTLTSHKGAFIKLFFHDGKLISNSTDNTIQCWDFNFPALTPYSKKTLQKNLAILSEMATSPQESHVANLHPDFQQRLKQHAVKIGTYPHYSLEVIRRVQIELCVEMLLKTVHTKDWKRVSQTIHQLTQIDPENETMYNGLLWPLLSSTSLVTKEEAALELKNSLKQRWGEDIPLLLADLGIMSEKACSEQLGCRPSFLQEIGILTSADLEVLGISHAGMKHIEENLSESSPDNSQTFTSGKGVKEALNTLKNTVAQRAIEAKSYNNNDWEEFQQKWAVQLASLTNRCRTPAILKNPEQYAKIVKEANTLIDAFNQLDRSFQVLKLPDLRDYVGQWGILTKWNQLRSQGISSLSALFKSGRAPDNLFEMGI
jgi:hypothetical protein